MSDDEPLIGELSPREHVRARPGMYFGGTDTRALHQLIYEVVGAVIRENAKSIQITLYKNETVAVKTDGDWLSVRKTNQIEPFDLEFLMSTIHVNPPIAPRTCAVSMFARLDLSLVNAVSATMQVEARQAGFLWRKTYGEGLPTSDLIQVSSLNTDKTDGYTFTFTPDFTVFEHHPFEFWALASRLRELTFLLNDVSLRLRDDRDETAIREAEFHYPDGLLAFMQHLNRDAAVLNEVIHNKTDIVIQQSNGNNLPLSLEFAIQYTDGDAVFELSFANGAETSEGGTHAEALKQGIIRFLSKYALQIGDRLEHPEDVFAGFTGVISIQYAALSHPGATTREVVNPEFKLNIFGAVYDALEVFAKEKPEQLQRIIDHCMKHKQNRDARRFGGFAPSSQD